MDPSRAIWHVEAAGRRILRRTYVVARVELRAPPPSDLIKVQLLRGFLDPTASTPVLCGPLFERTLLHMNAGIRDILDEEISVYILSDDSQQPRSFIS